jgi:Tfp pilus assembly protein PilX
MHPVRPSEGRNERGAALLTVILLLLLASVLVAAYASTIVGERAMSSNVHIGRGALYASDAGVRLAEQSLANLGKTRLDSLKAIYNGIGGVIKQPTKVFPAGNIVASQTNPSFNTTTTITFSDSLFAANAQLYNYEYQITSTGQQGNSGKRVVVSSGVLRLSVGRGSFADYMMFTNVHTMPSGSAIWFTSSGNFEGRVHTNGEFRFQGRPTFQDLVTSVNAKAWYYNNSKNGGTIELNDDHNGTTDVPNFYGGFLRSQPPIDLPTNSYSQQNAALGGDPLDMTPPSNATIRNLLGLPAGGTAPPNGIYFPDSASIMKGGIYVQGALDKCALSVDGSGRQVYQLTQGATVVTVTVDRTANTTTVVDGSGTRNYTGQPRGIVYASGNINDLGGPNRSGGTVPPALADNTNLLVVSNSDVVIQHDITYHDYYDGESVLGVFSSGGKVRIGTSAPNDLQLNAYVMAAGGAGAFQVDNYDLGSARGTVHLTGGIVAQYYGAFGQFNSSGGIAHGYARDFHFDDRGLMPPYYPTTTNFTANLPSARTLTWKEQ